MNSTPPPSSSSSFCCPICLDPVHGESFLDPCFHRFCFHCILQWSYMASPPPSRHPFLCPLCKSPCASIIHDLSRTSFCRHFILPQPPRFSLSQAHLRRLAAYLPVPEENAAGKEVHAASVDGPPAVEASECKGKMRIVHGDVKPKNRKPENRSLGFLLNRERLGCWIRRELQALLQEEDVDLVMHHVVGVIEFYHNKEKTGLRAETEKIGWKNAVSDAVRPFVDDKAEKFTEELENFLASGLSIEAYDQMEESLFFAPTISITRIGCATDKTNLLSSDTSADCALVSGGNCG